jgi:hypothetical protein
VPEGLSDKAEKVYNAMKLSGFITEDKMATAEKVASLAKLPKGMAISGLQELEAKGYAKRRAREKAAGYYLTK